MDVSGKMEEIVAMIEGGDYFVINRPRQYGKTTMLYLIGETLKKLPDYLPIEMNFQGIDERWHDSDRSFAKMFFEQFSNFLLYQQPSLKSFLEEEKDKVVDLDSLSKFITRFAQKVNKKIVLLIDEVDASANYLPFINFLGMLRTKYLKRYSPIHTTFHNIILAGVHDIKSLKYKIQSDSGNDNEGKYLSPWNIASDFEVRMSFISEEIEPMLVDYQEAEGVKMSTKVIAERLYYYTSGYPFLISKLCKIIAEKLLPKKSEKTWALQDVEAAVRLLLKENNTNFDSLIKNLENNIALYDLIYKLIIDGDTIPFNQYNPAIHQGVLYGLLGNNGQLKIHNRIYEQLIYEYMTSKTLTKFQSSNIYAGHFLLEDNELDVEAVLLKFQQFMKESFSHKTTSFLEEQGRLVFLAFLAPILNGQGYSFKEVQTSLEKRLDIIVTYFQHRYILELKQWYGEKAHEKGLIQLADYLTIHGLTKGYLIIFDNRKKKKWKQEQIAFRGKEIFAIWV
jgi:hypothetical protein